MSDAKIEMLPLPDWPDGHMDVIADLMAGGKDVTLDTMHLPDDVVANQFVIALWVGTAVDNPRIGSFQAQFVFGDRVNPTDLSLDEVQYVRKVFDMFLRQVVAK